MNPTTTLPLDPLRPTGPERHTLAYRLLLAGDWFDIRLRTELNTRGYPALNQTQLRVMMLLSVSNSSPSALARSVGITKQSMHTLLQVLETEQLVSLAPKSTDRRSVDVKLSPRGDNLMRTTRSALRRLERKLAAEIGLDRVAELDSILRHPTWFDRLVVD
jgi:DNA-binding MarR family transcriptional regulator